MTDEILPYYDRELRYIQNLAAEFAERHPEEAAGLRVSANNIDDPHVERLIQAFALLCARIRFKIDDDFPELIESLLGHLYPHYLAPVPSMTIVQCTPAAELDGYYALPIATEVETEPVPGDNVACRYRSCYPVVLRPIRVQSATLSGLPLEAPANPIASRRGAAAVLKLTLACNKGTFREAAKEWSAGSSPAVRFFISGARAFAFPLYELLLNQTVSIAVAKSSRDDGPLIFEPDRIKPVGFETDEGVVPFGARSFVGYRLLTEYFSFPEKFLFFDLDTFSAAALAKGEQTLEIFFYLNRSNPEIEERVNSEAFALGCTPVVNLFEQRAEPITLTQTEYEYPVYPDRRKPNAHEVYSIDSVVTTQSGRQVPVKPFYAIGHEDLKGTPGPFWQLSRRQAAGTKGGTEAFLSFVDLGFNPSVDAGWVVSVDTTCLNRDLPNRLPFAVGRPRMRLVEGVSEVSTIGCLTPPTHTLRMPQRNNARWRLMSHLLLNHLSLTDSGELQGGAEALQEMLRLYDIRDSESTRKSIESVRSIRHSRGVARVPYSAADAFYHGIDVEIEFDRSGFPGGSAYLLAAVLERFLAAACSINAFTRLTARVTDRQDVLRTWPPRAGNRVLL